MVLACSLACTYCMRFRELRHSDDDASDLQIPKVAKTGEGDVPTVREGPPIYKYGQGYEAWLNEYNSWAIRSASLSDIDVPVEISNRSACPMSFRGDEVERLVKSEKREIGSLSSEIKWDLFLVPLIT